MVCKVKPSPLLHANTQSHYLTFSHAKGGLVSPRPCANMRHGKQCPDHWRRVRPNNSVHYGKYQQMVTLYAVHNTLNIITLSGPHHSCMKSDRNRCRYLIIFEFFNLYNNCTSELLMLFKVCQNNHFIKLWHILSIHLAR